MRAFIMGAAAVAVALAVSAGPAAAQDHEKCYQIKDPAKIKGFVDLTSPQFGLEAGCKVGPAKWFCVPASKSNVAVTSNKIPVVPLPLYAPPAPVDRICYKVKCPAPFPPDQNVTDQFGNRTVSNFKTAFMCTPAVKGPGFCGNGVIDPGEDCDAPSIGGCTVGCEADCTCTCPTACCYVEDQAAPPETECFQYTGTAAQLIGFALQCTNGAPPGPVPGSLPGGPPDMFNTVAGGPCVAGPIFGTPCISGPPGAGNLHIMPTDSSCP